MTGQEILLAAKDVRIGLQHCVELTGVGKKSSDEFQQFLGAFPRDPGDARNDQIAFACRRETPLLQHLRDEPDAAAPLCNVRCPAGEPEIYMVVLWYIAAIAVDDRVVIAELDMEV